MRSLNGSPATWLLCSTVYYGEPDEIDAQILLLTTHEVEKVTNAQHTARHTARQETIRPLPTTMQLAPTCSRTSPIHLQFRWAQKNFSLNATQWRCGVM